MFGETESSPHDSGLSIGDEGDWREVLMVGIGGDETGLRPINTAEHARRPAGRLPHGVRRRRQAHGES
jgi:hypothetical protein